MIILGRTNDDKGKQFEAFLAKLLEKLGYQGICTNVVGSGGSEVDVSAYHLIPLPGKVNTRYEIVGECKATLAKCTMDDWHKLLGKLFLAKSRQQNCSAILLALNGFNGNVLGAQRDFDKLQANQMILIGPEEIEEVVGTLFNCRKQSEISDLLKAYISDPIMRIELLYYNEDVLWLAEFSGSRFGLLRKNGEAMSVDQIETIRDSLESIIVGGSILSLHEEKLFKDKMLQNAKVQIAALFILGGKAKVSQIMADLDYSETEHRYALNYLIEQNLVSRKRGVVKLATDKGKVEDVVNVIRFWMNGLIPNGYAPLLLSSDTYKACVDDRLCEYILGIQGSIPVKNERFDEMKTLLRLSPSAIMYALTPQGYFLQHRTDEFKDMSEIDKDDEITLFNSFAKFLSDDFLQPALSPFYFEDEGIREIEQNELIVLKGTTGPISTSGVHCRYRIGPLGEGFDRAYVLMSVVDGSPEPWEPAVSDQRFPSNYHRATFGKAELYRKRSEL